MAQRLLLKILDDFFSNLLFSGTIWGMGREKVQQRCRLSSYLFIRVHLSPCRQCCM